MKKTARILVLTALCALLLAVPALAAKLPAPELTGASAQADGVKITWSKVSGATGYIVYRRTDGTTQWHKLAELGKGSTLSYTDTKAWRGKVYHYTVRSLRTKNGVTEQGGYDRTGISGCKQLTAPKLQSTEVTGDAVRINWSKARYADGYLIYRKSLNGSWKRLKFQDGAKFSYVDDSAKTNCTYLYTVRAYQYAGEKRMLGKFNNTGITGRLPSAAIQRQIDAMTLEEKVAQLFIVTPEDLTGTSTPVTAGSTKLKNALKNRPVGGIILFSANLKNTKQTKKLISSLQSYSNIPLMMCVDEEGGVVSRISGRSGFGIDAFPTMYSIGQTGKTSKAKSTYKKIGTYLSDLGFTVDFAPVADVWTNRNNTKAVGKRSFGSTAPLVSGMVSAAVKGIQSTGVDATLKHFPGHGDTVTDSHDGYAQSTKTLSQLRKVEFKPFQAGIDAGAEFVMVGHISVPKVTGSREPSSLSKYMITTILRRELGFDGVITSDSLRMGAVIQEYTSAQAAVKALKAGNDCILMPQNFSKAYNGVLKAVKNGSISEYQIDQSVSRILLSKTN